MPPPLSTLLALQTESYRLPGIFELQDGTAAMARTKQTKPTACSSELGDGDFAVNYNPKTGRPIRKSLKADSPFVDSAVAISDDEDSDDEEAVPVPRSRKRKRSPSPPLSGVADDLDALTDNEAIWTNEHDDDVVVRSGKGLGITGLPAVTGGMQFTLRDIVVNVPVGHKGPIVLHLSADSAPTTPAAPVEVPTLPQKSKQRKRNRKEPKPTKSAGAGFLDLPAELRNEIYRLTFVANGRLNFGCPMNFGRSVALLRTCRQVHGEGRGILYAENEFFFNRRTSRYGSFWEEEWRELGFRSVRQFLKTIGPMNTSLIRHISFQFEDATPCLNPDTMSHEARRFVNDDILMSTLRHLGNYAQLQTLKLSFHGRRRVETTDDRFLTYLKRIKADKVEFAKYPIGRPDSAWASESKQEEAVRKMLSKAMVRREKLYE